MAKYFNAADVFLYPTLADNCPLTVLESIAC
jgi:glycosyltransferase involved in cell wall biosynthesis